MHLGDTVGSVQVAQLFRRGPGQGVGLQSPAPLLVQPSSDLGSKDTSLPRPAFGILGS